MNVCEEESLSEGFRPPKYSRDSILFPFPVVSSHEYRPIFSQGSEKPNKQSP